MSMPHPEPPSSTIHGELRGHIIGPPPMPPMPPMPPPGAGIELLRDTVEVQARTIRYLLSNYEALLRKVGHHDEEKFKTTIEWKQGADRVFAAGATIPAGWWVVAMSTSSQGVDIDHIHGSSTFNVRYQRGQALFSNGATHTSSGTGNTTLAPIETEVKTVEIENGE